MEELLARKTRIPIHLVEDGMLVEANRIYLIPAKKEMVIASGRLRLTERSKDRSPAHPIDQFLRSMAADVGRSSVAVVLSGTGSDGSRGVKDVHGVGGLVIVQDERTAPFDGMPLNAQATGGFGRAARDSFLFIRGPRRAVKKGTRRLLPGCHRAAPIMLKGS
jgi:two-component system CheB/CheR fusion protein